MPDFVSEYWSIIRDFLADEKNETAINLLLAILAALAGLFLYATGRLGALIAYFTKDEKAESPAPAVLTPIPKGASGVMTLTLEEYEARIQRRGAEIAAQMATASEAERRVLEEEKAALAAKLADVETSFAEARKTIAGLQAMVERYGNELGPEKLEEAERIFAEGDFDAADALLAEIEDKGDLEVERTAAAAFQRGKIAEEQVRWLDAAEHYAKAARLAPDYDRLNKAGEFLWRAGRHDESLMVLKDLLALSQKEYGENAAQTSVALDRLATTLQWTGRYAEAEPLFRQALEIDRSTIGERHPDHAARLNNLALLLRDTGRHGEAERLFRQALAIDRGTIGEEHPHYATDLNNLASLLHAMGRHGEAEPLYRQALAIDKATLGEEHPAYATDLNNLASLLHAMDRDGEAEPLYRQALAIDRATLGEEHPDYARDLHNLATFLEKRGMFEDVRGLYAQALEICQHRLGDAHPHTLNTANNYADFLIKHGEDEADAAALAELREAFGEEVGR